MSADVIEEKKEFSILKEKTVINSDKLQTNGEKEKGIKTIICCLDNNITNC